MIDLYTGKLSSAGQMQTRLFGSVHDATRDGVVVLLALTLSRSCCNEDETSVVRGR